MRKWVRDDWEYQDEKGELDSMKAIIERVRATVAGWLKRLNWR